MYDILAKPAAIATAAFFTEARRAKGPARTRAPSSGSSSSSASPSR